MKLNVQNNDGEFELDVNVSPEEDTVWLSADGISKLFERDASVINKHIRNIYSEGELLEISTEAKNASMLNGREYITKLYSLDVIISVGYRVKSQRGIIFRKWATSILRNFIFQKNPCVQCKEKIIERKSIGTRTP
ncbi:MAG: virulence RhuM family protein [bacterium]|nr:virulence RhuM family protein [bacterium]